MKTKDPDEVLDFSIDWSEQIGDDTIVNSVWSTPAGITEDSTSSAGKVSTIWLSGGTDGEAYVIGNRITTAGGRTFDSDITILVRSSTQRNGLVTLEAVKQGLRIEENDWDDLFTNILIPAASRRIIRHLKSQAEVVLDLDSGGNVVPGFVVPEDIQLATITLVAHYWRSPDVDGDDAFKLGTLPYIVTTLLYTYRDPALA